MDQYCPLLFFFTILFCQILPPVNAKLSTEMVEWECFCYNTKDQTKCGSEREDTQKDTETFILRGYDNKYFSSDKKACK